MVARLRNVYRKIGRQIWRINFGKKEKGALRSLFAHCRILAPCPKLEQGETSGVQRPSRIQAAETMSIIFAIALLAGVATNYQAADYGGRALYCGGTYNEDTIFVALPVSLEGEYWQCGDQVQVRFEDGAAFWATALDTGPFFAYRVEQWGDLPIVVDVPDHLWTQPGISAPAVVFNESLFNRLAVDAKMGHK